MLQNKEWQIHTLMVNYWKAHKPVCFVHSYVLSITQQYIHISMEQHEKHRYLCNPSGHYGKYGRFTHEVRPISQCVKAIAP